MLDVAFWVFQEGTAVNWVGGGSDSRTYLNGGGRDFRRQPGRVDLPCESSALVPGRLRPRDVDRYSGPRSDGLLSTDEISGNYCCCCFPLGFGATTVMPHGPDVIEQWGWCWFTTLCLGGEVRVRNPGTNERFRHWKGSQQRDDVYARRGLERALVPLQDGVEDAAGLPTRGHEGHRRVVVLLLLDAHDRLVLLHGRALDKDRLNHSGCAWILLLPLLPFNEVRTRLYVNGHPTNGFYGPDPNNIDWYRDGGCVGNGPSCSTKCKRTTQSPPGLVCKFLPRTPEVPNSPAAGRACPPSARALEAPLAPRVRVGPPLEAFARRDAVGRPDDAVVVVFFRRGRGRQTDGRARGDLARARRR